MNICSATIVSVAVLVVSACLRPDDPEPVEYDAQATYRCLRGLGYDRSAFKGVQLATPAPQRLQSGSLVTALIQTGDLADANSVDVFFGKTQHEATVQFESIASRLGKLPIRKQVLQRRSNAVLFWNVPATKHAINVVTGCLRSADR